MSNSGSKGDHFWFFYGLFHWGVETTELDLFRYSWFEVWDCTKEGPVFQATSRFSVVSVCKLLLHEIFWGCFLSGRTMWSPCSSSSLCSAEASVWRIKLWFIGGVRMSISHILAIFSVERLDIMFCYHVNMIFIALIDLKYICIFIFMSPGDWRYRMF